MATGRGSPSVIRLFILFLAFVAVVFSGVQAVPLHPGSAGLPAATGRRLAATVTTNDYSDPSANGRHEPVAGGRRTRP